MAPCREDAWDGDGRGSVTMATVSWQRGSEGDALHVDEEGGMGEMEGGREGKWG